jgi:hypothetical protein
VEIGNRELADASQLPRFVAQASSASVSRIRDVLLVPTTHVEGDYLADPPAGDEPFALAGGLTLERLSSDDAELVLNACTPRGHFFIPVRQYGQRYSFVLNVDPAVYNDHPYHWDEDNLVFYTMVLSRLVRDNGYSLEYAARIVDHEDGAKQVIPVNASTSTHTYRLREDRDWLTVNDAEELRQLVAAFLPVKDELPRRVSHGLNIGEDAVHLRIIQRSMLLIATGLEGLLQTSRYNATRQFVERLPQLAADVGVDGVDEAYADELYNARSEAAHGSPVGMFEVQPEPEAAAGEPELPDAEPESPAPELGPAAKIALAQDILRAALRRAIESGDFRSVFLSPHSIEEQWPLRAAPDGPGTH